MDTPTASATHPLGQGRPASLAQAAYDPALPCEHVSATDELDAHQAYGLGKALLYRAPLEARAHLVHAYAIYCARCSSARALLCVAAILETFLLARKDYGDADVWIAEADALLRHDPDALDDESVQAALPFALLCVLIWRAPRHPLAGSMLALAVRLMHGHMPYEVRLRMASAVALYCLWCDDQQTARLIVEWFAAEATTPPPPATQILHSLVASLTWSVFGHTERSLQAADHGLAQAECNNVRYLDFQLWSQKAATSLRRGDIDQGLEQLDRIAALLEPHAQADTSLYHYLHGWAALLGDALPQARAHLQFATQLARAAGLRPPLLLALTALAHCQTSRGQLQDAAASLSEARALLQSTGCNNLRYMLEMVEADHALACGEPKRAHAHLHAAFDTIRRHGHLGALIWLPKLVGRMCQQALLAGVDGAQVSQFIKLHRLPPPCALTALSGWPHPLEVRVLGPLVVLRDGQPLDSGRKAHRKLHELLGALIALGGRDVPTEKLAYLLWPQADGDLAQRNLKATLHRLRVWLGPEALTLHESRLSIEPAHCHVDALALEEGLDQLLAQSGNDSQPAEPLAHQLMRVLPQVRAPLLPDDHAYHIIAPRERLRSKLVRTVHALAERLLREQRVELAIVLCERALDTDPLAECLHQLILRACLDQHLVAQGLAAYERCCRLLQSGLGAAPSPQTDVLAASLRHGAAVRPKTKHSVVSSRAVAT